MKRKNLSKLQFEMRLKNLKLMPSKDAERLERIEFLRTRILNDQRLLLALEEEHIKALEKQNDRRERITAKLIKNVCPVCYENHTQSPPDDCWVSAFRGDETLRAKFKHYVESNRLGRFNLD